MWYCGTGCQKCVQAVLCNGDCGASKCTVMGAGVLISAMPDSRAAADFQAAVSGEVLWRNRLLQIMQAGSHAQAALVCQIWTSLLSRKALADNVNSGCVSGAALEALGMHLQPTHDTSKKVRWSAGLA